VEQAQVLRKVWLQVEAGQGASLQGSAASNGSQVGASLQGGVVVKQSFKS